MWGKNRKGSLVPFVEQEGYMLLVEPNKEGGFVNRKNHKGHNLVAVKEEAEKWKTLARKPDGALYEDNEWKQSFEHIGTFESGAEDQ